MTMVRVGLVHALGDSMGPTATAMKTEWPEAECFHVIDGSLYLDRSKGTATETEIDRRIASILGHAATCGPQALLFTGSFFGSSVAKARAGIAMPVFASFDGIVEEAFALGSRFHVVSTAPDSSRLLADELRKAAAARGASLELTTEAVREAATAREAGDLAGHDELIASAMAKAPPADAILFAQFTMGPALAESARRSGRPVLAPPEAAVRLLRRRLEG